VTAALLSLGAYETFTPLILLFAAGLLYAQARRRGEGGRRRLSPTPVALAAVIAVILLMGLSKALFTSRAGDVSDIHRYVLGAWQLVRLDYDWRIHSGLNIFAAPYVHFWLTLRGWAAAAWQLLHGAPAATLLSVAAIALASFWRLRPRTRCAEADQPQRLLLLGLVAFVAGHAIFLIVPYVSFSPTGIGNRMLVAAAIGVAIILVAAVDLASRLVPPGARPAAFAAAVAVLAAAGAARTQQIGRYWAQAPQLQRQVLARARADLAAVPAGSTILLDGVCPYHGPAVVFETHWDVGPALSLALGRPVSGDAVSSRVRLFEQDQPSRDALPDELYPARSPGLS
jgi:hypothetical protein